MNKWAKRGIVAAMVTVVAVLSLSLSAFAAHTPSSSTVASGQGYGMQVAGRGNPALNNWGGPQNSLVAVAANVLGMQQADLVVELQSKTLAQVAQEKGVATDTIVNAFLAPRIAAMQSAVQNGSLTQAQADQMIATMKEHVTDQLNMTWSSYGPGMSSDMPMGGGFGGRWARGQ